MLTNPICSSDTRVFLMHFTVTTCMPKIKHVNLGFPLSRDKERNLICWWGEKGGGEEGFQDQGKARDFNSKPS